MAERKQFKTIIRTIFDNTSSDRPIGSILGGEFDAYVSNYLNDGWEIVKLEVVEKIPGGISVAVFVSK